MSKHYAIGIDLGGTNLRAALVSHTGRVIKKIKEPSSGDVMSTLRGAITSLLNENILGIGIGAAGLIDRKSLSVMTSPNMRALDGRSFAELKVQLPMAVENDANCAALGEKWVGAGKDFESFVLLTLGTGIGGGIIHNGKLLKVAAEAGHMSVASDGVKCMCGNHGCLEQYASARAITEAATKALEGGAESILRDMCSGNIYKLSSEDIFNAACDGDNLSRDVLRTAGKYLGSGIANLINLLSPEAVILTGGLIGAWDIYVEEAIREVSRRALRELCENVKILPSALGGDDAGAIGAAGLILHGKNKH